MANHAAAPAKGKDPQEAKAHPPTPAPPNWETTEAKAAEPYPDGPLIADEQRKRSAEYEAMGQAQLTEHLDEREDEKPTFDAGALAGGGAFVAVSTPHGKAVAGVAAKK